MKLSRFLYFALLPLCVAPYCAAQNIFASLTGTVHDQSGAVLPGATVTAVNQANGLTRVATTSENGDYLLNSLPAGTYTLSAEIKSFRKENRQGVVLQVDQKAREDFSLTVASQPQEAVTVEAETPVVDSESAALGQVVNNTQVLELPLNGRDFTQLLLLAPGVTPAPRVGSSGSGFSISGNRSDSNTFVMDGADNNEPGVVTVTLSPSIEMIQEFKLEENNYSAEFGRRSGGQINLTTKSGGNQYHGSAYDFLRNSVLDAKNYFASPTLPTPPLKRNQFGASFGGKIKHDRTFFFANWESTRLRQGETGQTSVPTAAMVRGDFSALLVQGNPYTRGGAPLQIINPLTKVPFTGNMIPTGQIDQIGARIAALFPAPNLPAQGVINFVNSPVLSTNADQYSLRIDHRVSPKAFVFGRYTINRNTTADPFAAPGNQTIFSGYAQVTQAARQNAVFSYTQLVSSDKVNEFRLGYTRLYNDIMLQTRDAGNAAQLGINTLDKQAYDLSQAGTPTITVSGFGGLGYPAPPPQQRANNTYQIVDGFSWTKGSHALKFGIDLIQYQIYQNLNGGLKGAFTFTGQFSTAFGSGFGLSDLLLGYPATATRQVLLAPNKWTYQYIPSYGFYALDDWKVTPKLTLNLGMRYEWNLPDRYKGGQQGAFNPQLGVIQIPSSITAALDPRKYTFPATIPVPIVTRDGASLCEVDKTNVAPRVGFAYRPFGDNKTVVRAGYGIFYNLDQFNNTCGSGTVLWSFSQAVPAPGPGVAPVATLVNPFPAALAAAALTLNANVPNQHVTPYVQDYSFGIQREVLPSLVVEARYVGTKGTHLVVPLNINQALPGAGSANSRRPFASLGLVGTITQTAYAGDSRYSALQLRAEQRTRIGLTFLGVYSYSKALDDSTGALPQNSRNLSADRGFSTFDITQRTTLSATYQLPFGRGRHFGSQWNGVEDAVLGGWQLSPIFSAQSGLALTPVITGDNSLTGGNNDRPNVTGDVEAVQPGVQQWFNTAAFALAPAGQFGNAGRGIIRGPGLVNLDVAIQKYFHIRESHQLQFRGELFNALNHPNLGNPNVSFSSALFGRITAAADGRTVQVALRYSF